LKVRNEYFTGLGCERKKSEVMDLGLKSCTIG
jgi:hypothetical protein